MKNKIVDRISNTMSDALEQAINDLELCEKDPRYNIDMGNWHNPNTDNSKCLVCLAGATLAQTCKAPIKNYLEPFSGVDTRGSEKLEALDMLRLGNISSAVETWFNVEDAQMTQYSADPKKAKADLRKLVKTLRKLGL